MNLMDHTIYHIYAKDRCLFNCLNEKEFKLKWTELQAMVGLMKTDFELEDLSYEKLPPGTGYGGKIYDREPDGGDSY